VWLFRTAESLSYDFRTILHFADVFHLQQYSPLVALHVARSFPNLVVSLITVIQHIFIFTQIVAMLLYQMGLTIIKKKIFPDLIMMLEACIWKKLFYYM